MHFIHACEWFFDKRILGNRFEGSTVQIVSIIPAELALTALYPLQVAKTKMINNSIKYQSILQTLKTIHQEEGIPGLYHGFGFTLFEILPGMLTSFIGFEIASLIFRKPRDSMSISENITVALVGSFLAGILQYPLETAKKKVQALKNLPESDGAIKTLIDLGENHGIVGLWKGFSANLFKFPALLVHRFFFHVGQIYFLKNNGYKPPLYHPTVHVLNQL